MTYIYEHPRPMLTVDIMVIRYLFPHIEILLIQRKNPPFQRQWALPGGFVEITERLKEAAKRELKEETGLKSERLYPLLYADAPERDPRGRTISFIFGFLLPPPFPKVRGGDDAASAGWFRVKKLPKLAFDHEKLIPECLQELHSRISHNREFLRLLPDKIKRNQLANFYRQWFGKNADISELLLSEIEQNRFSESNQFILINRDSDNNQSFS